MKRAFVDVDDLWQEQQIKDLLLPLREAIGEKFKVTAYAIPNKLGPVHDLVKAYPWITFAIHGFEHTFAECRAWHSEVAEARLQQALDMGYAPVFKAPNWILDIETEIACRKLNITLHHHKIYEPATPGLMCYPGPRKRRPFLVEHENPHTHIVRSATDKLSDDPTSFITECPDFKIHRLKEFDLFLSYDAVHLEV